MPKYTLLHLLLIVCTYRHVIEAARSPFVLTRRVYTGFFGSNDIPGTEGSEGSKGSGASKGSESSDGSDCDNAERNCYRVTA